VELYLFAPSVYLHGVDRNNFIFISNHAVSSSEYIVSKCVMISEQGSGKFVEGKGHIVFSDTVSAFLAAITD
jgi:hypothetical protein